MIALGCTQSASLRGSVSLSFFVHFFAIDTYYVECVCGVRREKNPEGSFCSVRSLWNTLSLLRSLSPLPSLPLSSSLSESLLGSWSARGCRALTLDSGRTRCACDALSTFALLARPNPESVSPLCVCLRLRGRCVCCCACAHLCVSQCVCIWVALFFVEAEKRKGTKGSMWGLIVKYCNKKAAE